MARMPKALFQIHRMRGGAQSHLMFCSDRCYYVVKFTNNPQHVRVLANEMLANGLARHIGLPVAEWDYVDVTPELIERTPDLHFQDASRRTRCRPGRHFGSRIPVNPAHEAIYDFVPDQTLALLENRAAFAGMLAFDQWTCNADARQAVFLPCASRNPGSGRAATAGESGYQALMIDQGFCFNDGEWNFPDSPLRGLYPRPIVYEWVTGWDSFEPWLTRIREMQWDVAVRLAEGIPLAWYGGADDELDRLLQTLDQRRRRLHEMLDAVRRCSRNPFPRWT